MELLNNVSDGAGFKLLRDTKMMSHLLGNAAAWGLAVCVGDTTYCIVRVYYSCCPGQRAPSLPRLSTPCLLRVSAQRPIFKAESCERCFLPFRQKQEGHKRRLAPSSGGFQRGFGIRCCISVDVYRNSHALETEA